MLGNVSFDEPERTEQALNVFTVLLSFALFARGVDVHAGVATFMAVVVPLLLRLTLSVLIHEYRYEAGVRAFDP